MSKWIKFLCVFGYKQDILLFLWRTKEMLLLFQFQWIPEFNFVWNSKIFKSMKTWENISNWINSSLLLILDCFFYFDHIHQYVQKQQFNETSRTMLLRFVSLYFSVNKMNWSNLKRLQMISMLFYRDQTLRKCVYTNIVCLANIILPKNNERHWRSQNKVISNRGT